MKILNRIVTFLLAFAVFPAIILRVLFRIVISISPDSYVYKLLSIFGKNSGTSVNSKMEFTVSAKELFEYWKDGTLSFGERRYAIIDLPEEVLITKNWLFASMGFIGAALIIALIIMGCALFAQSHKTVMGLSAGGILSLFVSMTCFNKFAAPFISGKIDMGTVIMEIFGGVDPDAAGGLGSLGALAFKDAVLVDILQLGNAFFTVGVIFFIILIWTFAYFITLPESERKKKAIQKTARHSK
ncbi:MAG: hypothetical protein MJ168_00895 [Clostridia bacterium]|nr:hypothetical protein [Clostridia bacterium]